MNKRVIGFKSGVSGGGIPETQVGCPEYRAGHRDGQEAAKAYQVAVEVGSPAYVDVIVRRWQEFTGKTATLDGDGRTFEEISKERQS